MALEEEELIDAPGLMDLESALNRMGKVSDLVAFRFLDSGESEMRFERTIFWSFTKMRSRFYNRRLKFARWREFASKPSPENTGATCIRKAAKTGAVESKWWMD